MLTLIAAMDDKRGIGRDGSIPWVYPEDMKMFREETLGGAVIMGRKTFNSLKDTPLKNRFNIVLTKSPNSNNQGEIHKNLMYARTCIEALWLANRLRTRAYGIGGRQIYQELLPHAGRMILTRIPGDYQCDVLFPTFDHSEWVSRQRMLVSELNITEYTRKVQ